MDRHLPADVRRTNGVRGLVRAALPIAGLAIVLTLLPAWLRPSLSRARIRTSVVTAGPMDAVVEATGTVLPEIERVLTTPVDARLLRVLKRAGMTVARGEPVAELDLVETELAWNRLVTEARIADTQASKTRITLERLLADLDGRIERTALTVELLGARADGQERLLDEGLASPHAALEARMAARQAAIELAQLKREREHAERAAALESAGLAYQREALDKQTAQARRLLELGTMRSDRAGVVTWVLSQEGTMVRRGDLIARIADLSSFHVEASVSDVHAARIRPGAPVLVAIDEDVRLAGSITQVAPSVEGGVVRFQVGLRERSHPLLRPDLRVDVMVITSRKARALKVRQGPFDDGSGRVQTFVIRGHRAIRRSIRLGLRGSNEVEAISGVSEGDEVVISDVRDYVHLEELEVR